MKFEELFAEFVSGTPIKRKPWKGHWIYKNRKLERHWKRNFTTAEIEVIVKCISKLEIL